MPDIKLSVKFLGIIDLVLEKLPSSPTTFHLPAPHTGIPDTSLLPKLKSLVDLPPYILGFLPKMVSLMSLVLDRHAEPETTSFTLEVDASEVLTPFKKILHYQSAILKIDTDQAVVTQA